MIKISWTKDKDGWSGLLYPIFKIYGYYLNGKHKRILTIIENKGKQPLHVQIDSVKQGKIIANKYLNYGKFTKTAKELKVKK